jgi:hypothetical protein
MHVKFSVGNLQKNHICYFMSTCDENTYITLQIVKKNWFSFLTNQSTNEEVIKMAALSRESWALLWPSIAVYQSVGSRTLNLSVYFLLWSAYHTSYHGMFKQL